MKKIFLILNLLLVTAVSLTGCSKKEKDMQKNEIFNNKKAILIIAHKGFQDTEYTNTRRVLEKANIEVKIASSQSGEAIGKFNKRVPVDIILKNLNVNNFDAIVFIGGPGAEEYIDNDLAHKIAQDAIEQKKILAAICISPETLAKAGVLKGKNATVWSLNPWNPQFGKNPIDILKEGGANYLDKPVVTDGNIITANGPQSATQFGKKIVDLLK